MKRALQKRISKIAGFIEIYLSLIILVAIVLASIGMIMNLGIFHGNPFDYSHFSGFLADAFTLVIGLEFIKMLIKHTPGAVVEVLLFAIARQLIVEHANTLETLIGIASIAGVFAIRKFLFMHAFSHTEQHMFSGKKNARAAGHISMVKIPCNGRQTLAEVVLEHMESQNRKPEENALVDFPNCSLRIVSMDGDHIRTVEVMPHHADD